MNILVGIKKLCIFFFFFFFFWGGGGGVITKLGLFLGSFLYIFFFLRSRYRLEISFGVAIISDILGGGGVCLIFLIFLFGKQ